MSSPELLTSLASISHDYDAVLCDIWGVLHNGQWHFPSAYAALKKFNAEVGPVVLISNSPRPNDGLAVQLAELGVFEDGYSAIVSSGDATRAYLTQYAPLGSAWIVGPARDANLYNGLDLDDSGTPQKAAFISCTGLYDDENDTIDQYRADFEIAAKRGIPLICANPDRIVQRGDKIILCAGSLADLYMALGGEVIMAGKPYPPIYDLCYSALEKLTGKAVDKSRILAIGDGLPTDVLGANGQGLDLLFIAAGIHAVEATGADGKLDPHMLTAVLQAGNAQAKYVAAELA